MQGGFRTIIADPPWPYEHGDAELSGGVEGHYAVMAMDDICRLPVDDIAAEDALLLLWCTNPKMPEAMKVVESWGFRHTTMRTWVKDRPGTGYWLRGQSEHLIIAKRGKPPLPPSPAPSVFFAPVTFHSAKPRSVYVWAESVGLAPRLELFARNRRHGWASWGNQLSATVETTLPGVLP